MKDRWRFTRSIAHSSLLNIIINIPSVQGTLTPLLGIGVCVSIQFGVIEYMKRLFAQQNINSGTGGPSGRDLGAGQLVASGVAAGLANGFVSGPVEHIRIRKSRFSLIDCVINAYGFKVYKLNLQKTHPTTARSTRSKRSILLMASQEYLKVKV